MVGLIDIFLSEMSQIERAGNWFWDLGRDSPVLGRSSCEGSHVG